MDSIVVTNERLGFDVAARLSYWTVVSSKNSVLEFL